RLVWLLIVCFIAATAALAEDAASVPDSPDYRIGIDDILDIAVWNVADLQKTVPVRPDGKISMPLVNDVIAAGLTPMELRSQLTKQMAAFVQNSDACVVVLE